MSVLELIQQKVEALPQERQREVLLYVQEIERQAADNQPRLDSMACWPI
jgi:hypothetical protein